MAYIEKGPTSLTKGTNEFEETGRFLRQLWKSESHHEPTHPELASWKRVMREKAQLLLRLL